MPDTYKRHSSGVSYFYDSSKRNIQKVENISDLDYQKRVDNGLSATEDQYNQYAQGNSVKGFFGSFATDREKNKAVYGFAEGFRPEGNRVSSRDLSEWLVNSGNQDYIEGLKQFGYGGYTPTSYHAEGEFLDTDRVARPTGGGQMTDAERAESDSKIKANRAAVGLGEQAFIDAGTENIADTIETQQETFDVNTGETTVGGAGATGTNNKVQVKNANGEMITVYEDSIPELIKEGTLPASAASGSGGGETTTETPQTGETTVTEDEGPSINTAEGDGLEYITDEAMLQEKRDELAAAGIPKEEWDQYILPPDENGKIYFKPPLNTTNAPAFAGSQGEYLPNEEALQAARVELGSLGIPTSEWGNYITKTADGKMYYNKPQGGTGEASGGATGDGTDDVNAEMEYINRINELFDAYGVGLPDGNQSPAAAFTETYNQLYKDLGLDTLADEIKKLTEGIEAYDNELAEEIEDISDNPWLSEALRTKKINAATTKINSKKNNLVNKLQLQQSLFNSGQEEARFVSQMGVTLTHREEDLQRDIIFKAMEAVEKEQQAIRELSAFDSANFKAVQGGLYDVKNDKWIVQPKPETVKTPQPKTVKPEDEMAAQLASVTGPDGFISPDDYTVARKAWVDAGLSPTTFDTKFKGYRNPDNPYYVTNKQSSSNNSGEQTP